MYHTQRYTISPNLIRVHFVLKTLPKINMLSFSKTMHFYMCVYIYTHLHMTSLFIWKCSIHSGNLQQCFGRNSSLRNCVAAFFNPVIYIIFGLNGGKSFVLIKVLVTLEERNLKPLHWQSTDRSIRQ